MKDWLLQKLEVLPNFCRDLNTFLIRATIEVNEVCELPDISERRQQLDLLRRRLQAEKVELTSTVEKACKQQGAAMTLAWVLRQMSFKEGLNLLREQKKQVYEFSFGLQAVFVKLDIASQRANDLVTKQKQYILGTEETFSATLP